MRASRLALTLLATTAIATTLAGRADALPVMWVDDAANNLFRVDVDTGVTTNVGVMGGISTVTDIAFAPNGDLFAVTFNALYRINTTTAAPTLVGALGISSMNALVFATDGTLYGAGFNTTQLYTINTATGAATALGNMNFASGGDLAFNGGKLFLASSTNQLVEVNLANLPSSAAVGPFGVGSVFGIATGDDGVLYGVAGENIYSINTSTGAATLESSWSASPGLAGGNGQSFITEAAPPPPPPTPPPPTPPPVNVPAPATAVLFGAALLGLTLRRRRG